MLIFRRLAHRGASTGDAGLMEQAGRLAGDQAKPSGAFAAHATNAARRLRVRPRQPGTRAASGPALGVLRPLCEELADGPPDNGIRKRGPELDECRKAFVRAAAERREARRWAIP